MVSSNSLYNTNVPCRIFTFWEPNDKIIPYLELCRKTWDLNLPGYEIITLDYSNVGEYIEKEVYDLSILKTLTLPQQKTAIMVAVLKEHGGVFMDMDTIVVDNIAPLIAKLEESEVVIFNTHVAFVASRVDSRILSKWLNGIQKKLLRLPKMDKAEEIKWDYVGNSVLSDVMEEMIRTLSIERFFQNQFFSKVNQSANRIFLGEHSIGSRSLAVLNNFAKRFHGKRKVFYFRTVLNKYLNMLDRVRYGFILEALHDKAKRMTAKEKYIKFWFESNQTIEEVFSKNPTIIGLHNSWTPQWYKELSKENILQQECLLSKMLNQILNFSDSK